MKTRLLKGGRLTVNVVPGRNDGDTGNGIETRTELHLSNLNYFIRVGMMEIPETGLKHVDHGVLGLFVRHLESE